MRETTPTRLEIKRAEHTDCYKKEENAMPLINKFTPEEIARINTLNDDFEQRMKKGKQGQIKNEDSFEKSGLMSMLRESPEFLEKYMQRAVAKIGPKPQ